MPTACKHLHHFPLCHKTRYPFSFLSLSPRLLASLVSFSAFPLSSQSMKWKGHGTKNQKTRVLILASYVTWGKSLTVFETPFPHLSNKQVLYRISSILFHSDMPSSLASSHQPMISSHLGSSLPFSSPPSLDPYFGATVGAQASRHFLTPSKASKTPPTPASSAFTELP